MIPPMGDITGWRKPSYSFSNGNCVEVGAWRKSSRCQTGECVEVGHATAVIGVRDTKLRESPVLKFSAGAWNRFAAGIKRGAR